MTTVSPNDLEWNCDECYGTLAIDTHTLNRMAWCVDLSPLWGSPSVRGQNTRIPGQAGNVVNPYRVDETVYSLPLVINGHWDRLDVAVAGGGNIYAQLEANVAWLLDNVVLTATTANMTQTAVLTLPSGATVTAEVQVLRIPTPALLPGAIYRSTLEVRDPAGALHL